MRKLAFPIHNKLSLKTETIRNLAKHELVTVAGGALTDVTCGDACVATEFGCQTHITCHTRTGTCPI